MTTKKNQLPLLLSITAALIILANVIQPAHGTPLRNAPAATNSPGLGYSEAPFALIDNPQSATGNSALAAVIAASTQTPINLERVVVEGDYAFMILNFNDIGVTAISKRGESGWQFVCRAGGAMAPQELTDRCSVPSSTAERLYDQLIPD